MENNPCVILSARIKLVSFPACFATVKQYNYKASYSLQQGQRSRGQRERKHAKIGVISKITTLHVYLMGSCLRQFHSPRTAHLGLFALPTKTAMLRRLPQNLFGTLTRPPFHCSGARPKWRNVKTLDSSNKNKHKRIPNKSTASFHSLHNTFTHHWRSCLMQGAKIWTFYGAISMTNTP